MINKKYNEFLPSMQSAEDLVSKVDGLSSNIDLLKAGIENEVGAPGPRCAPLSSAPNLYPPSRGVARALREEGS